jgi:hypothetical protein
MPDTPKDLELRRAFLLCQRGKFDDAERMLKDLSRRHPGDPQVSHLLARIGATRAEAKNADNWRREWRYHLGLASSSRRFCAIAGSVIAIAYGAYGLSQRIPYARKHGWDAPITTQVYRGSRYNQRLVDYTRPVRTDVAYYAWFVGPPLLIIGVVWFFSRGSALWEDFDYREDFNVRGGW